MNICIKCKHCVRLEPDSPRANADYNIRCAGFDEDIIPCLDPVLGVEGYTTKNSLGDTIFCFNREDARPTCRSKNTYGGCKKFIGWYQAHP